MKNHKEFRDAVFEKAAAYEKQRKLKRQKALRIALSVCTCLAVFIAVAAVPFGLVMGNMDEAAGTHSTTPDVNAGSLYPSVTTTELTSVTTCATTAGTFDTTAAATTCTTLAYTQTTTLPPQ